MKNIKHLLLFLNLVFVNFAFAQDEFYYTFDYEKVPLITISGEYLVHFTGSTTITYNDGIKLSNNIYVTTDTTTVSNYSSEYYITPAYMSSEGGKVYEPNQIVLQFKKNTNSTVKNNIISTYLESHNHIEIIREKEVLLLHPNITLNNITFPANKRVPIYIGFSFLSDEILPNETQTEFPYRILQKYSNDDPILGDNWMGGVHFKINRQDRDGFDADAGPDKEVYKNEDITIYANQIGEAATYNWYNSEGELIYTGQNLTISPDMTAEYELEVIALSDGVKDYDEVEVIVNNSRLNSISPNPATAQITVEYETENTNSAYLMILGMNNFSASNNYILDANLSQTTINISNYPTGLYTVALVCNGQIVDAQALMIQ